MTGALSNVLPLSKLFVYVLKTKQTKIIYVYIFGKLHLQGAGTLCISVFKSLCLGLFVNSKNTDVLEKHQLQDSHKKNKLKHKTNPPGGARTRSAPTVYLQQTS